MFPSFKTSVNQPAGFLNIKPVVKPPVRVRKVHVAPVAPRKVRAPAHESNSFITLYKNKKNKSN